MHIVLPTREEDSLAGLPANQPRMGTDRHGLGDRQILKADTKNTNLDGYSHLS
jgi:hypothetical protein